MREIEALCNDDRARREWLWLRAREHEDELSIDMLERTDPQLRSRMAAIDGELGAIADPRERRQAYGRLLDQRGPDMRAVPCGCPDCAAPALR